MNLQEIKKLMEIFGNSQIAKLNLKDGEFELKLEKYTSQPKPHKPQLPQNLPQARHKPKAGTSSLPLWLGPFIAALARAQHHISMSATQSKKGKQSVSLKR